MDNKQPKFLKKIPHEYIIVDKNNPNKDKRIIGIGSKWNRETAVCLAEQCNGYVACNYNLKNTEYAVIDIDNEHKDEYNLDKLYELCGVESVSVEGNSKGHHVWVKFDSVEEKPSHSNHQDCFRGCKGDYLGEKSFERIKKDWNVEHTTEPQIITIDMLKKCFDTTKIIKTKKIKSSPTNYEITEHDTLLKICDLIDPKYLEDRKDYLSIICAIRNCNLERDFAIWFSRRTHKFDLDSETYGINSPEDFDNVWNSNNVNSTEGTIRHFAKLSNPEKYKSFIPKKIDEEIVMVFDKFHSIKSDIEISDELQKKIDMYSKLNQIEQRKIDDEVSDYRQEVEDDMIHKKAKYFEKFHFKVMSPACFGRIAYNKTSLINAHELELQYENVYIETHHCLVKWTKTWRDLKYIRTFENVDFLPHPLPCPNYTLNTFNGLRAEKLPECEEQDIDLLLNHINILTGNNEEGTKYVFNYLAHSVQKPGELPRVALVFQSDQGTGKNIFFENFVRSICGGEYLLQTAEMDKVIGRFSMVNNKLYVIMDETNGKDSFSNSDKIKNTITAEQIAWERKGIDGININNCGRYIFFSNNQTPVKIEASDRRYVVFTCSNERQNDSKYFKKMASMFKDDEIIKTFYNYLMNIDISDWDSINDRPITEAYQDIQSANTPVMAKWLEDKYYKNNYLIKMKSDETVLNDNSKFASKVIYDDFINWLESNGFKKMEYNTTKFGREIIKYDGLTKKRTKNGVYYILDYTQIKTYLINKRYMEQEDEELNE